MNASYYQNLLEQAQKLFSEHLILQATQIYKIIIRSDASSLEQKIQGLGTLRFQEGYFPNNPDKQWLHHTKKGGCLNCYDALSICYSISKKYAQGILFYQKMLGDYPNNICLRFGLANIYNNQGKIGRALGEYEKILASTKQNRVECLRELILLSFSTRNQEQCRQYLQKMGQNTKQIQVKAVQGYLLENHQDRIAILLQLTNKNHQYPKLCLLLGSIYEQIPEKIAESIKIYQRCMHFIEDRSFKYFAPYICLSKLYRKLNQIDKSLQVIKRMIDKDYNNWLSQLFLAQDHFKLGRINQSIDSLKICLMDLRQNKQIYLSEQNRSFMVYRVTNLIKELQKSLIYNRLKFQLKMDLSGQLHSIFEQDINTNITNIRTNNPHLFHYLKDISLHAQQNNISTTIYDLFCQDEINLQLVDLYSCNHILKSLKKHNISLSATCNQLRSIFTQKIVERETEVFSQIDQPYQKHEYKLKLKSKIVDAFSSKQIPTYFSKYEHLFMVVKKIAIKSKKARIQLQILVDTLKLNKNLSILEGKVVSKVEQKNQWICINEVIQELLPETHSQPQFLRQVQRQFAKSYHKSFHELTGIMIKKWQQTVTRILDQKRSEQRQIKCEIADWITVQLVFPSQTRLICCLQQIKKWAKQSAAITGLDGNLETQRELRVKVIISQVCCMIKLKVNHGLRIKMFNKVVRQLFGQNKNIIFNVFLNAHKQHDNSLLSYLKEMAQNFQQSHISTERQVFSSIKNFVGQIEPIQNWDQFSRYQRNLTGSWINSSKPKRSGQRLFTQGNCETVNQIKTEQSVQTELVNPGQLAIQREKSKERVLQRTASQNNIIHQSEEVEQNDNSKRSMLLPSVTLNESASKKCLAAMEWKQANSEHESQAQIPDLQPNNQKILPNDDYMKELEQTKAYLSQLKDNQELLIAKHIEAISQKQAQITYLGKQLEIAKRSEIQLQQSLISMKQQYEYGIEKTDWQNKQVISDKQALIQILSLKLQEKQSQFLKKDSMIDQLKRQLFGKNQQIAQLQNKYSKIQCKEAQMIINFSRAQLQYIQKIAQIFEQNTRLKQNIQTLAQQTQQIRRQKQETLQRLIVFSQKSVQINLKIQQFRSQNEDLGTKAQQLAHQLQDMKQQMSTIVSLRNQEKYLAEAKFKKAEQQFDELKIEYQTSKAVQCPCFQRNTAQKKLQCFKIIFMILFFQAIGISFTLNIMK